MKITGKATEGRNVPSKGRGRVPVRIGRYLRESKRRGLADGLPVWGMTSFGFFTALLALLHVGYRSRDWVWTPATKVFLAGMLISLVMAGLGGLLGHVRDAIARLDGRKRR